MKSRIFIDGFLVHMCVIFPISIGWVALAIGCLIVPDYFGGSEAYVGNMWGGLFIVSIELLYLYYLYVNRKKYFSIVTMNDDGVIVSCWGKPWFEASWGELKYVGYFVRTPGRGGMASDWIYFSKAPVTLGKNIRSFAPNNDSFQGNGFFMELYKKETLPEVYKHIPKEKIRWEGFFVRERKE